MTAPSAPAPTFPALKRLTESAWFRHTVLAVILLAGVVVGLETSRSVMAGWGGLVRTLDWLIMGIFSVELVLRLAAHLPAPGRFFRDPWNVFDFIIVVVCLLPVGGHFAAVLRLARVLRLLRMVSAVPRLQFLVAALFKSLGSMGYVGLLLFLLFYIYSVIGVSIFGAGDEVNFGSIPVTMLTLFRIITLEGWVEVMNAQFAAGVHAAAVVAYFVSFILVGTMIMLNLFIGIILNGMTEMQAEADERRGVDGLAAIDSHLKALQQEVAKLRSHTRPS
jgi:voltage-gated sodium channel